MTVCVGATARPPVTRLHAYDALLLLDPVDIHLGGLALVHLHFGGYEPHLASSAGIPHLLPVRMVIETPTSSGLLPTRKQAM